MKTNVLQRLTGQLFQEYFGRTPLTARLDDIFSEAVELHRSADIPNLKEEAGDLGASLLALCEECGFKFDDLVKRSHDKIKRRAAQYKSLGRKVKVALFGGAFDPPTLGHIAVAKFVLNSSRMFDEVWLTPCFNHLYNKNMAACEHRLAMCQISALCDGRIKVFDYEIKNQLRGETYHFAKRLLAEKFAQDEYDFSLIIGMDNANTFDRWINFKELEKLIRFVVVPRLGEIPNPKVDWYLRPPHIFLQSDDQLLHVSSTDVRNLICEMNYDDAAKMMNPEVLQYIQSHGLYKERK